MRYADDTITNEQQKVKNGERTLVTAEALELFLGGDNTNAEAWEMLLDILNNQYPVDDAIHDIIHNISIDRLDYLTEKEKVAKLDKAEKYELQELLNREG